MKSRRVAFSIAVLLVGMMCGGAAAALAVKSGRASADPAVMPEFPPPAGVASSTTAQQGVFPDVAIPGVPIDKNLCLSRVAKSLAESRAEITSEGSSYNCDGRETQRHKARYTINLRAGGGQGCDQADLLPSDSVLTSEGGINISVREGFAHYSGEFLITSPRGRKLYTGRMELFYRVGSHRTGNLETCDENGHVEGWLVGRGTGFSPTSLRAMIAGKWSPPTPRERRTTTHDAYLTGLVLKPV